MKYNMFDSISHGPVKLSAMIIMTVHLIVALPIVVNPANQYLENVYNIPKGEEISLQTHLIHDQTPR